MSNIKGYKCKNIYTKNFKPNKRNVYILLFLLSFFLISKYNKRIIFFSLSFPFLSFPFSSLTLAITKHSNYSHKARARAHTHKKGGGSHLCVTQTERAMSFHLKPISDEKYTLKSFMEMQTCF